MLPLQPNHLTAVLFKLSVRMYIESILIICARISFVERPHYLSYASSTPFRKGSGHVRTEKMLLDKTTAVTLPPQMLRLVYGAPYRNQFLPHVALKHAFSTVGEFLDHYREVLMLFSSENYRVPCSPKFHEMLPYNSRTVIYFPKTSLWKVVVLRALQIDSDWATCRSYRYPKSIQMGDFLFIFFTCTIIQRVYVDH